MNNQHKICTKCSINKKISLFNKSGLTVSGAIKYRSECKECTSLMKADNYQRNREAVNSRVKANMNSERGRAIRRKHSRKIISNIDDSYIASLVSRDNILSAKDIGVDLIKVHRKQLTIKRKLKLTNYGK